MPAREPKISEALLAFARPLLEMLPEGAGQDEMASVLRIAALVWNAVALEQLGHDNPYLDQGREILATKMRGIQRDLGLSMLAELEDRKRRESPPDLRLIGEFRFIERDGVTHLRVECHAAPEPAGGRRAARVQASPAQVEPPTAGVAAWRALYDAAEELRRRAPWEWMGDLDIFGVRDPRSGTVGWCIVLGSGGELFGLAVYLGERGFDQIRRMHLRPDQVDEAAIFGQDAMVLTLLSRNEVDARGLQRIRSLGLRPHGRNAWPVFESHATGRLPLPLAEEQVGFMRSAILQTIEVAARIEDDPDVLLQGRTPRLLVRVSGEGGRTWADEWIAEPAAPDPGPPPHVDQLAAHRELAALPRLPAAVECDVFPLQMIIDEKGRPPYAPAGFLAVDADSGFVLHSTLGHPDERAELACRELLSAFRRQAALPTVVVVCRDEVETALAPLAGSLGFELVRASALPRLQEARRSLTEALSRGPGKPRNRTPKKGKGRRKRR